MCIQKFLLFQVLDVDVRSNVHVLQPTFHFCRTFSLRRIFDRMMTQMQKNRSSGDFCVVAAVFSVEESYSGIYYWNAADDAKAFLCCFCCSVEKPISCVADVVVDVVVEILLKFYSYFCYYSLQK